ncbi:hypothetical protein HFN78_35175 [Rhizobium laguerreae]|uniref:hypothetical protein n=1 Tax=Rhizobium laguerreae TaxID=1076926 RepID=UPI001C9155A9|nr:hypothetical protein [Rhizobium laguerreae]MBY3295751.1 hypothetical protein [Rhizobium laguerreae]MBY3476076.1 hypothetical protein [Rhizobium laguerreae]MBY3521086.1 hypothetical protein [Rhizobium laguerreae]
MTQTIYVSRGANGKVNGIFSSDQIGMNLDPLSEDHPDVVAFRAPSPVSSVSARQFRLQLRRSGLLAQVKTWVAQQDGETQDAFEYSGTFVKDSPMMTAGFAAMGFSPQQIDDFFAAAAEL